jgi:hypothetical protein
MEKNKPTKPLSRLLSEQAKQKEAESEVFRQTVISEELRARYQKAIFEKMDFYLKWNKIVDEYNELLEKNFPNMNTVEIAPETPVGHDEAANDALADDVKIPVTAE